MPTCAKTGLAFASFASLSCIPADSYFHFDGIYAEVRSLESLDSNWKDFKVINLFHDIEKMFYARRTEVHYFRTSNSC